MDNGSSCRTSITPIRTSALRHWAVFNRVNCYQATSARGVVSLSDGITDLFVKSTSGAVSRGNKEISSASLLIKMEAYMQIQNSLGKICVNFIQALIIFFQEAMEENMYILPNRKKNGSRPVHGRDRLEDNDG